MLYTQKIIDYYQKIPASMTLWDDDSKDILQVQSGSYAIGEFVIFQVKLDAKGCVLDCRYQVLGCGYMIALVVWLAEKLHHNKLNILADINIVQLQTVFQLPKNKRHCALTLLNLIEALLAC